MLMWFSWRGEAKEMAQDEVEELTNQFYVTLRASVARLDKEDEARSPKTMAEVEALLKPDRQRTWSEAYQLEQLLVDLYSPSALEVELKSRLLEADSALRPKVAEAYVRQEAQLKEPAERRALLGRLVNDLQWRYTVNEVKRRYTRGITRDTGIIFIGAIVVFATAFLLRQLFSFADGHLLLIAGLAGGWGAAFSMMATLRSRLDAAELDDLKRMRLRWLIWSRPLIGAGAACILYFFLVSGLLAGSMFPNLGASPASEAVAGSQSGAAAAPSSSAGAAGAPDAKAGASGSGTAVSKSSTITAKDLALLVVWCF